MTPATEVLRDRQWAGQPAYVVGGGPSLRGFDFSPLRGRHTIGVNAAFFCEPEVWYATDDWVVARLVEHCPREWDRFRSIRIVHQVVRDLKRSYEGVLWLRHGPGKLLWGASLEEGIAMFSNSGLAAVNLADILGADPIYLLGFDLRNTGGRLQHWHDFYPEERVVQADVLDKFLREFCRHGPFCRARVFNACPESALELWPKITLAEAVAGLDFAPEGPARVPRIPPDPWSQCVRREPEPGEFWRNVERILDAREVPCPTR